MAGFELRLVPVALAALLVHGGCDARFAKPGRSSVTVKLPPARAQVSAPAFSFTAREKPRAIARP
jgi:hypothetical protein